MDTLVFIGEDKQSYPNIHGKAEHYGGGTVGYTQLVFKKDKSKFSQIRTRYLFTLRAQLAGQQKSDAAKDYIENMDLIQFKKLEQQIENQIVKNYNAVADSVGSDYQAINAELRSDEGERQLKAVDDLIDLVQKNMDKVAMWNSIEGGRTFETSAADIANAILFRQKIADKQLNSQAINQALTSPSEGLAALIGLQAEKTCDDVISYMIGDKSTIVQTNIGRKKTSITTKSADIRLPHIQKQVTTNVGNGKDLVTETLNIDIDSFATVKSYYNETQSNLTSYGGDNSKLMDTLKKLYGSSNEALYNIYNSIAFSGNSGQSNWQVMRSDLIAEMGEKFLVGFDASLTQRILVHNFTAYPILSILSAVVDEARDSDFSKSGYGRDKILGISLDKTGFGDINVWEGTDVNSNHYKFERIRKAKKFIDTISYNGTLNMNKPALIAELNKVEGIPLR